MERWEHMEVHTRSQEWSGRTDVWTVGAPDYRRVDVDTTEAPGDVGLWHLDQLGAQGWQLVAVQAFEDFSTYWLKRRTQ